MYRIIRVLFFSTVVIYFSSVNAQPDSLENDSALVAVQEFDEFQYDKDYNTKYAYYLRKVRRVYPLALHVKKVLDSLDNELAVENRKRKQRKMVRKTHRALKADFKFLIKELYISDGKVLAKLIYRETGMSVYEILEKYKSPAKASTMTLVAKAWEQDFHSTYDPKGEDFILERAVEDVNAGLERFDPSIQKVDKEHYKKDRKAYRKRRREAKKANRRRKREKRKEARKKGT